MSGMTTRRAILFVLLAALAVRPGPMVSAEPAPLVFGILNQQSPTLTAERWNPILAHVSTVSGVPLRLRMGRTVIETDDMMGRGEFDFAFTNHNFQTEYEHIPFRVIARWAGEPIRGVIAVPMDSAMTQLKDLGGQKVAFPSRDAFVAYAVPVVAFKTAGITVQEVMAGNQDGALAQLKARQVQAAAVNSRFLKQYMEREGVQFREIYLSDPYPDLAVIAHPRVPAATVDAVRKALIGMKSDRLGAAILESTHSSGFEPATDRDYEAVRRVYKRIGQ
jgi:phosphonate transport system substrate-binding protein